MNSLTRTIAAIIAVTIVMAASAGTSRQAVRLAAIPLEPAQLINVEARCALPDCRSSRARQQLWRLVWNHTAPGNYDWAELAIDFSRYVDGIDTPMATLSAGQHRHGTDTIFMSQRMTSGLNLDGGFNSLMMEWTDGSLKIYAGNRGLQPVFTLPDTGQPHGQCGIISHSRIDIMDFSVEAVPHPGLKLITGLDPDSIRSAAISRNGKPTGIWAFLDRENDTSRARPGGRYTLAVIESDNAGEYLIIYLDGAQINAGEWHQGMIKGKLRETEFENHYRLLWYDALMDPVEHDIFADCDGSLLTLSFPLMRTRLRFSRRHTHTGASTERPH